MHWIGLVTLFVLAPAHGAPSVPASDDGHERAPAADGSDGAGGSMEERSYMANPYYPNVAGAAGTAATAYMGYMPPHGYGYQCFCPNGGAPVIRPYYPGAGVGPYPMQYGANFNPYTNVYAGQMGVDPATAAFSCGTVCGETMARCQTYCHPMQNTYACAQCLGMDYRRCQPCFIYTNAGALRTNDEAGQTAGAGDDFQTGSQ